MFSLPLIVFSEVIQTKAQERFCTSLEASYRHLQDTCSHTPLQKVRGWVSRLISYGGKGRLKNTLMAFGSQQENSEERAMYETWEFSHIIA
jgi:hypothetical protein